MRDYTVKSNLCSRRFNTCFKSTKNKIFVSRNVVPALDVKLKRWYFGNNFSSYFGNLVVRTWVIFQGRLMYFF